MKTDSMRSLVIFETGPVPLPYPIVRVRYGIYYRQRHAAEVRVLVPYEYGTRSTVP
jgi:hypothetical protein